MKDFKKSFSKGGPKRSFNKPRFGAAPKRDASQPLELFDATCASCGAACRVPFRPNGKKPVLCKECFDSQKGEAAPRTSSYARPQPREKRPADLHAQIEIINSKLDTLTRLVKALAE